MLFILTVLIGFAVLLVLILVKTRASPVYDDQVYAAPSPPTHYRSALRRLSSADQPRYLVPGDLVFKHAVRSHPSASTPGLKYQVDLAALTCTCPDHARRRGMFEGRDVRILCKHLTYSVARCLPRETTDLVQCLIGHGPIRYDLVQRTLSTGDVVVFGFAPTNDWIDVFARARRPGDPSGVATGRYERYSFNESEERWSYGRPAYPVREIKNMLG